MSDLLIFELSGYINLNGGFVPDAMAELSQRNRIPNQKKRYNVCLIMDFMI